MSKLKPGIVIKSTGSWYLVKTPSGEIVPCRITGKFRLDGLKVTNPVAVGDHVKYLEEDEEETIGTIKEIDDRKNFVVRQSPRKKHNVHLIASNVDQAILIITIKSPMLKQGFIDRFLIMTEPYDIPVTIVFNKLDLYDEEDMMVFRFLKDLYEKIGYDVLGTSIVTKEGIETLREKLLDKTSLISGQSGVGKSSIVNALNDGLDLATQDLSDYTGKGQHTTTFAEMLSLSNGAKIIDTPGIKTLAFNHLEVMDVAHNFKEFFEQSSDCKFGDCTHRNEPKCAVKEGIESGDISNLRYQNYLQIISEIEDQNYWERNTI